MTSHRCFLKITNPTLVHARQFCIPGWLAVSGNYCSIILFDDPNQLWQIITISLLNATANSEERTIVFQRLLSNTLSPALPFRPFRKNEVPVAFSKFLPSWVQRAVYIISIRWFAEAPRLTPDFSKHLFSYNLPIVRSKYIQYAICRTQFWDNQPMARQ